MEQCKVEQEKQMQRLQRKGVNQALIMELKSELETLKKEKREQDWKHKLFSPLLLLLHLCESLLVLPGLLLSATFCMFLLSLQLRHEVNSL